MKKLTKKIILSGLTLSMAGQTFARIGIEVVNNTGKDIEARIDNFTDKEWVKIEAKKATDKKTPSEFLPSKTDLTTLTNSLRRVYWREYEKDANKNKPLYSTWETFLVPHVITIGCVNPPAALVDKLTGYDITSGTIKKTKTNQNAYLVSNKPGTKNAPELFKEFKKGEEYKALVKAEKAKIQAELDKVADDVLPVINVIIQVIGAMGALALAICIALGGGRNYSWGFPVLQPFK
jgi:hypothetical protein